MGIKLETLRPPPATRYVSAKREVEVCSTGPNQKSIRVTWFQPDDKNNDMAGNDVWLQCLELFRDTSPEVFALPLVMTSLAELKHRSLSVSWQQGRLSLERYSQKLKGLQILGATLPSPIEILGLARVWPEHSHGSLATEEKTVTVSDFYCDTKHADLDSYGCKQTTENSRLITGFTWNVEARSADGIKKLIFPIADLEVAHSDQNKLNEVGQILAENGFSGSLIRSGDFTHYLGDILFPQSMSAKIIAQLIDILTPPSDQFAHQIATKLAQANPRQAKIISQEILAHYPSGTPTGSDLDLRWAGHIFTHNQGRATLRCSDGKGNSFSPYEIGLIS